MATEVADVTEPVPAPAPVAAPARMSRLTLGIGVAGFAALLCAGGTVVYTSSHKSADVEMPAISAVASPPPPKLAPPPVSSTPDPASTMFSTAPKPAQGSAVASGRTSNSAATLPDFSLPAFDWNPPPPPELPAVDWSALMGQVAAANTASQAGAIIGPIAGTAGTVFAGTTSLVGDLILASAYNGNGMTAGVNPITALLSVIGAPAATTAAPNAFAALQSLPPIGLPPPPPAIGLPPPPDLMNPLGLPPPPDLMNPLGLPPPPPIGLPPPPNLNPLGLHVWPFF
jgi:hypothetical protein